MKKLLAIILIFASFVYAKERRTYTHVYVNHSEPMYEYRYDRVYEQCEEDYYRSDYEYYEDDRRYDNNTIGVDTLIGATLGVAIGNQIGKGNGRDVARVAGGLLGATIANNTRDDRRYNTHHKSYKKKKHYSNCDDGYYTQRKRKVLVGYKNYFTYDNKEYFKVTKRPKNRIKVTKTISF